MNLNLDLLRVCETLENSHTNDEDRDLLTYINWEKTNQLRQMPKYANFDRWLEENGVLHPGVDYPVAFGRHGQLIGMAAKKDITPQKAFLFVPQRLIISEITVMNSPLQPLITKHPELFKHHQDAEYLVLIAFVWYELLKGEQSFWHHYFQIINISDLPMLWSEHEIEQLQDQVLQKDIQDYRAEYEREWILMYETFKREEYEEFYPGISDPEKEQETRATYDRAYLSVVTRCFGWGLPKTSMIPFADCINHHNVDSTYDLIHIDYHQDVVNKEEELSGPKQYYTGSKLEGDYSDFYLNISDPIIDRNSNREENQQNSQNNQDPIENQATASPVIKQKNKSPQKIQKSPYEILLGERKEWPKRTQNQMDKVYRRKQVAQMQLSEITESKQREIWDVEYLTTSDEEDNDTEEDIPSSESENDEDQQSSNTSTHTQQHPNKMQGQQNKKNKKRRPAPKDVVYKLIEQDDDLQKRDLQARLLKLKNWKESFKKFNQDNEVYDVDEDFSWWSYFDDKVYYAMGAKFKTFYRKGDQLFNCYGLRNNRFLLINYGFCLRNNKYNSLGFKVFVNYLKNNSNNTNDEAKNPLIKQSRSKQINKPKSKQKQQDSEEDEEYEEEEDEEEVKEERETSQHQKIIRLKREKLCEELLQYLRANMIFTEKFRENKKLLASSPVDIQFEIHILSVAISLLRTMFTTKYPTTLQEDKNKLADIQLSDNYRLKLALIHRINQKEILQDQIKILRILLRIMSRVQQGMPLKEAYCLKVEDCGESQEQEVVMNRVRLRKYLREFNYYQTYYKRLDQIQKMQDQKEGLRSSQQ